MEAVDGPTGRSKPVKKGTAGKAAAQAPAQRRNEEEDDESELEYDDDAELNFQGEVHLASVQEDDEEAEEDEEYDDYDSEDNVSPPGDLSTPLKKAYTRCVTQAAVCLLLMNMPAINPCTACYNSMHCKLCNAFSMLMFLCSVSGP